jgi:DNA-binding transcriptional regulator YiaG
MNAITHIRKNKFRMTQAEFAAVLGVHQSTVCRWEKGRLHPSVPEIQAAIRVAQERGVRLTATDFVRAA